MLSEGENLFPLTSEQKAVRSRGFPSLPGCEALVWLCWRWQPPSLALLNLSAAFTGMAAPCAAWRSLSLSAWSPVQKAGSAQKGSCCSQNWFNYASANSLQSSSLGVIAHCRDAMKSVAVCRGTVTSLCR